MKSQNAARAWNIARQSLVHVFQESVRYDSIQNESSTLILTSLPYPDLNMAILQASKPDPETLAIFVNKCHETKSPCLFLVIGDQAICRDMKFHPVGSIPLMHLQSPPSSNTENNLKCGLADSDIDVIEANCVVATTFDIPAEAINSAFGKGIPKHPGLQVYTAKQAGLIVSSLRISRIGKAAVIWCMATSTHLQRQGIGRQLLLSAIASELQSGADEFYLLATPAGVRLYEKVGFTTISESHVFLLEL